MQYTNLTLRIIQSHWQVITSLPPDKMNYNGISPQLTNVLQTGFFFLFDRN